MVFGSALSKKIQQLYVFHSLTFVPNDWLRVCGRVRAKNAKNMLVKKVLRKQFRAQMAWKNNLLAKNFRIHWAVEYLMWCIIRGAPTIVMVSQTVYFVRNAAVEMVCFVQNSAKILMGHLYNA
jgi:hypothetical protein